jgi:L-aspartate oxidase
MESRVYRSDFLVIGSGIAGLTFAIKASRSGTVHIVTKKQDSESSTNYAQGGIASVLDPKDSFESHIGDTLKAGAGLNDSEAVEILVREGPNAIRELLDWGCDFSATRDESGGLVFHLGREGGHSFNRIVHAADLTGAAIEEALLKKVSTIENIRVFENHTAVDLLTEHQLGLQSDETRCYGAYILDNESGAVDIFSAPITLLCTGGVGQVYPLTTNPLIATGDGIAMAYRAGAAVADMEFIQFHPTALYVEKKHPGPAFLISEAVRGEGAILINSRYERFMERLHPLKELAPRDIVARAIDRELKRLGDDFVYLDISFKGREFLEKRFPKIFSHCMSAGIDISRDLIPVAPVAHYLCGGIVCDTMGRTDIKNLYVSGECSRTGVHGANRLASNSLLEGVVFSIRACEDAVNFTAETRGLKTPEFPAWNREGTFDLDEWILVQHNMENVKRLMWDYVGIVRSDKRLRSAYARILMYAEEIHEVYMKSTISAPMVELRNLATVAKLIIRSAMTRKDSIGLHYNSDHPETDAEPYSVMLRSGQEPLMIRKIK